MISKTFLTIKILILGILIVMLNIFIYPTPKTWATSHCPNNDASRIKILDGFLTTTSDGDNFELKNPSPYCIIDNPDAEINSDIRDYGDMVRFYRNSKIQGVAVPGGSDNAQTRLNGSGGKLYRVSGDFIVRPSAGVWDIREPGVIFVDGNLIINTNIDQDTPSSGVIFVVQGNVYVHPSVDTINAFIITFGYFCSLYGADPDICSGSSSPFDQQLTINGSVITLGSEEAKFVRKSPAPATVPAERVIYQPKYMIIAKDILSYERNLWTEIQ